MEKALVLSSGGLDSTVCVGLAVERFGRENVCTLSAFYGQKHAKELECARNVAEHYGLAHRAVDLTEVFKFSSSTLLSGNADVREGAYSEQLEEGEITTVVPFRNGVLLSAVAAMASSLYPRDICHIYIGAHADDAAGNAYPDCSEAFLDFMAGAINIGTYGRVFLEAPLSSWNKARVVQEGIRLGTPFQLTWSCYRGGGKACGKCGTCIDRLAAFAANGIVDPVEYEHG